MNSILLCEGSTDFVLLQYFMREVYAWEDKGRGVNFLRPSRRFQKDGKEMVIGGTGGSSQIIPKFQKIIESNRLSSFATEYYQNIAIVTDRDEISTEADFLQRIKEILQDCSVDMQQTLRANIWNQGEMMNARGEMLPLQILLLVIPFEETGAMLTSRRYLTKAKFDVYFSIRTPEAFFMERQNILRGIDWKEYVKIQECFKELEQL